MTFTKKLGFYHKLLGIFALLFSNSYSFSQTVIGEQEVELNTSVQVEYEIGGIVVNGTDYLDKNVIILSSGLTVGDKIFVPGESITKAIKIKAILRLQITKIFSTRNAKRVIWCNYYKT